jgi:hypothetical protein
MSLEFRIGHAALHFVDPTSGRLQLSIRELDLSASDQAEKIDILHRFLVGHLENIWLDKESQKTCAAGFTDSSNMRQNYEIISQDESQFFACTCDMARELLKVSPPNASKGLLMVLLFKANGADMPVLGLLKMDPSRKDSISLLEDEDGNVLLDLAVRTINQKLPDPADKVLKWAVIPHPTRPTFDAKLKDKQGGSDPAKYFLKFLGVEEKLSAIEETNILDNTMNDYFKCCIPQEIDSRVIVRSVIDLLAEGEVAATLDSVSDAVEKTSLIEEFDKADFRRKLTDAQIPDLCVPSEKIKSMKVQYNLPNGIVIKGPREAMDDYISIEPKDDGSVTIKIETGSNYTKKYV